MLVITTYKYLIKIQWKVCTLYLCRLYAVTNGGESKLLIVNSAICSLPTCSFNYIVQWTVATSQLHKARVSYFPPSHGAKAPSGLGSPRYQGFMITLRRTTLGRTPLDEWSARSRDLYLRTHSTHKRQISMTPAGFEPVIPASERPQTQAVDRAGTAGIIYCAKCASQNRHWRWGGRSVKV
jgi:hypothetical protein